MMHTVGNLSLCPMICSTATPPALPRRSLAQWVLSMLALVLFALPSFAQPAATTKAQSFGADAPRVQVSVLSDSTAVAPGDNAVLAIVLDIAKGWKINTNDPQIPASWGDFPASPTTVQVNQEGKSVLVGVAQWPKVYFAQVDLALTGKPEPFGVFKDKAIVYVPLLISPDAKAGADYTLTVNVGYQACDDTTCDRPEVESFPIKFSIVEAGKGKRELPAPNSPFAGVFDGFDPSAFAKLAAGEVAVAASAKKATSSVLVINDFGLNLRINTQGAGIVLVLLLAAVGGFLLNLMPCVLPVIPIKIIGLQKSSGTARRRIILGLIMSAGVIAFWLAVGSVLALSTKFVAGSQLFGIWWFAMGIGIFIFCMGLGMLGIFDVGLPNWVYSLNPKHDSAAGSFGFGVLTAVLALPCVAPFMGTAMSWALGRPPAIAIATFGAIGIGMALPYAILSIAPKLVAWLPRTGPASDLLKQIMGLLMMAVSVFFIATGIASLTSSKPYLSSVLHWWIIAIMVFATAAWLVFRTFAISKSPARRGAFTLLALLLAGTSFVWARAQTDAAFKSQIWKHYSPEVYAAAKASGKTIVLDFTADWCLNCKTLKATVLNRDEIIDALTRKNVVPIEVDLTATDAQGWELLKQLGHTGIPLLVIEVPGMEPWASNAYTPSNVLDVLK